MKKIIVILLCILLGVACISCAARDEEHTSDKVIFNATVTQVYDGSIVVEPDDDTSERSSSDKISVSLSGIENAPTFSVGDRVSIEHNGRIKESYPAQLDKVYSITKIA